MTPKSFVFFVALVVAMAAPLAAQDDAEVLDAEFLKEQAEGSINAKGFSRLEILELHGTVSLRTGPAGKISFSCRDKATRREQRAVGLWSKEGTLILGPGEGLEEARFLCETIVPPNMPIVVEVDDGHVVAYHLTNDIEVGGSAIEFDARGHGGSIKVDVEDSMVRIDGVAGGVTIEGKGLDLRARKLQGTLSLVLSGGKAKVGEVSGNLDADLTDVVFKMDAVDGDARVRAKGGEVTAVDSAGSVTIDAQDAKVSVERIAGTTTIAGSELQLQLRELAGNLSVETSSSQVVAAGLDGVVTVQNDFGDVVLARASRAVSITNAHGNVRVTELSGPMQLEADGPEVTVQWTDTSHGKESALENKGGNITILFAPEGGGKIDAQSRNGQVRTKLSAIDVAKDGKSARGNVNRMAYPKIKLVADGDVILNDEPQNAAGVNRDARAVRPNQSD